MKRQVTFLLQVQHPPGYRRTSYIFHPATTPTWLRKDKLHLPSSYHTTLVTEGQITFPLSATPHTWLWKDKLHFPWLQKDKLNFPSSYHTYLVTEGQVTFPLQLPCPPGYGRTSYIYPPLPHLPGYWRTSYISPSATMHTWLWKDKLHLPSTTTPTWLRKDKLHFPFSYLTDLIMEGQVTFTLQLPHTWLQKDKLHLTSRYHTQFLWSLEFWVRSTQKI